MKKASSTLVFAALMAASATAPAQVPSHNTSGVSYRTLGTSGPEDQHTPAQSSGASGTAGSAASGGAPASPNSTGGSHTPDTSASGEKADCPGAIARSAHKDGGSASTGSGYALSGPSTPSAGADCAAAASGASGSGSKASGPGNTGTAPSEDASSHRGRNLPAGNAR